MKKKLSVICLVIAVLLSLSACSKSEPSTSGGTVEKPTPGTPSVSVLWVGDIGWEGSNVLRFLAEIKNPGTEPLAGVVTEWVAYDENDSIIGSYDNSSLPTIPGEGSIYYVGGAGDVAGAPSRVELTIKNEGHTTTAITPIVTVSDIQIVNDYEDSYSVTAQCQTDTEIKTEDLDGQIILKDANGQVIFADFWSSYGSLPDTLPAGGKFNLDEYCSDLSDIPVTAEIYMYVR